MKNKRSGLDAAALVLAEVGKAMAARQLVEVMKSKRLWKSPAGRTPHATIYAGITRDIKTHGRKSRFRHGRRRGSFMLSKFGLAGVGR